MENGLDFVAIGDITTDAFIKIKEAEVSKSPKTGREQLCVSFGDKIPYEEVIVVSAVGNSPNASVSAHRLGLKSALMTDIGDDDHGQEDLETLKKEGILTDYIKIHQGKKSNYHYVLWHNAERTILIKHEEYPYKMPDIGSPKWIYFSSVGENSLEFHHQIAEYVKNHSGTKLAFQPGTFQIKLGHKILKDLYAVTELFFCNVSEAQRILETDEKDVKNLLRAMCKLGPKIVVITDGPDGAYVYDRKEMWHMPMYPDPAPPVDRTGAGDSFSSTFTSALALGMSIPEALKWGPINSMSVVQYVGAQEGLLTREELKKFLAEAPENYEPTKIN